MTFTRHAGAVSVYLAALVLTPAGCAASAARPATPTVTTSPWPISASPTASEAASAVPDPNAPEVMAAGDIPDNQVFVPYSPSDGRYTVSVPEGWSRADDGAAVVFTDKFNSVRLETVTRAAGAPDVTSARAEELPVISASVAGFGPGGVTAVTRKGGPAVLITYTATSPVDPVTAKAITTAVERYEFWRAGQEAVVTLSGARGADNVDPWRIVSDSFRWR